MDDLIKRLSRYSKKCLEERTDSDFADAVDEAKNVIFDYGCAAHKYASIALGHEIEIAELKSNLKDCRNELCLKCGDYKMKHRGACNGCRWDEGDW